MTPLESLNTLLAQYGFSTIHVHKHPEVAVVYLKRKVDNIFAPFQPCTLVLHRCECGDKFVQELDGTWTLSEVRGKGD